MKKFELVIVRYQDDRVQSIDRIVADSLIELAIQLPKIFTGLMDKVWDESKIEKAREYDDNLELPF